MSTKDIFENLVADITEQVLQQVQQQSQEVIVNAVNQRIDSIINSNYISNAIEDRINKAVVEFRPDMESINSTMQTVVSQLTDNVTSDLNIRVNKMVGDRVNEMDINSFIANRIDSKLENINTQFTFPDKSINLESVDITNIQISGNSVSGGVIKNFGSTGIDDKASVCQVTILDQGTVFENSLYAPRIEVKGGATIDGDLEILGSIVNNGAYQRIVRDSANDAKTAITDEVLTQHQNLIFERIQNEGLDLSKVTFGGRVLVDGDRLVGVVNSQLRTVGVLQDLQTSGECYLSDTLYSAGRRVGINTMDPKSALSIWDEEVEIGFSKTRQNVGRIATERENDLVLGSNNKDNITLQSDGSVIIPMLQINNMMFTSSVTPPSYSAQRGTVVFNENPSVGGPLGCVSLGDAIGRADV